MGCCCHAECCALQSVGSGCEQTGTRSMVPWTRLCCCWHCASASLPLVSSSMPTLLGHTVLHCACRSVGPIHLAEVSQARITGIAQPTMLNYTNLGRVWQCPTCLAMPYEPPLGVLCCRCWRTASSRHGKQVCLLQHSWFLERERYQVSLPFGARSFRAKSQGSIAALAVLATHLSLSLSASTPCEHINIHWCVGVCVCRCCPVATWTASCCWPCCGQQSMPSRPSFSAYTLSPGVGRCAWHVSLGSCWGCCLGQVCALSGVSEARVACNCVVGRKHSL